MFGEVSSRNHDLSHPGRDISGRANADLDRLSSRLVSDQSLIGVASVRKRQEKPRPSDRALALPQHADQSMASVSDDVGSVWTGIE
jgi:hypothetical protein